MKNIIAYLTLLFTLLGALLSPVQGQFGGSWETPEKQQIETGDFTMDTYDLLVSPDGNDAFSGKRASVSTDGTDGPLKTVAEAKNRLRALKAQQLNEPVTVWLRGGRYTQTQTLRFTDEDLSGVTYKAYPGETPVISGAVPLSGWREETVNGVSVWTADADGSFNALYSETGSLPRTRWPQSGYFTIKATHTDDALYTKENTPWEYTLGERSFFGDKDALTGLEKFHNLTDITCKVMHYWKDENLNLNAFDPATGLVTFGKYASMIYREGDRFFFENVFETLNSPGEWYLDKTADKLYYVPQSGDNIESTVLYAPVNDKLLDIDNCDSITFQGITFSESDWHILADGENADSGWGCQLLEHPQAAASTPACLLVNNAKNIVFDACVIKNIGFSALKFDRNVQDCSVTRSLFQNIGANAVFIRGDNADNEKTVRNITVSDNVIYRYGRVCANAIGVLIFYAQNCTVTHNEIHDGYYTAVSVGWVWGYDYSVTDYIDIGYNLIYDIGQGWLSDMGGIYTLAAQPHSVLHHNTIHHVAADPSEGGYGGWGVYLDEGSSHITVEQNLVYACGSQSLHIHYGADNIIRNNIFALSAEGQIRVSRKEDHFAMTLTNNIIVGDNTPLYVSVEEGKFTDSGNILWDYKRGGLILSSKNADGKLGISDRQSIAAMTARGYYAGVTVTDPLFKDPQNGDFTLAENSPALEKGFVAWNFNEAGTLTDIGGY